MRPVRIANCSGPTATGSPSATSSCCLRSLLGSEAADLEIKRFALPNLRALNVVVRGLLGTGVAASTRPDPQAKGLERTCAAARWTSR